MTHLSNIVIDYIVEMNDKIFEQELLVEQLERTVSAQRHYLSADKNEERVLELRAAMANLKAARKGLATMKEDFECDIDHVYTDSHNIPANQFWPR